MVNSVTASLNPLTKPSSLTVPSLGLAAANQATAAASTAPVSATSAQTAPTLAVPALGAAVPAASDASMETLVAVLKQVISTLNVMLGGSSTSAASTTSAATSAKATPALAATSTPTTSLTQPASTVARKPVIAQIDTFQADNTGFNHGQEIAKSLSVDKGAGAAELKQYDLKNTSISGALNDIIAKVKSGQTIDAVELPQQNFTNNAESANVRAAIQQLSALGVPVVIAAGNSGPNQKNSFADNSGLVVQNIENGKLDANSGTGNVSFEGRTTSFASANLAAVVAAQRAKGASLAQIKQQLGAG